MSIKQLNTLTPKKWIQSFLNAAPTLDSSNGIHVGDIAIDNSTEPQRIWKCTVDTIGSPVWIDQDLAVYVPKTTTVNGHALTGNVTVSKADVGLSNVADVNTTTTVNINDSTNKRFVTDADLVGLSNVASLTQLSVNTSGTGIISGGILTVASSTTFNVSAGTGWIVNNTTNPIAPTYTRVSWNDKLAQTSPYRTTAQRTEVWIDIAGELRYTDVAAPTTPDDFRDYIYLGRLIHNTFTTITSASNLPNMANNTVMHAVDISEALGSVNMSGNVISPNGANLKLNTTGGQVYRIGSNYVNNTKAPNIWTSSANISGISFTYRYRDGAGGFTTVSPAVSNVDVGHYDNGTGTLATVGNTDYTIQRVWLYAGSGNYYVTYGQTVYNKLSDAQAAIPTESPVIDPVLSLEACLRCFLIVRGDASALNNTTQAYFKAGGKLGEPVGGGAAGGNVVGPGVSTNNSIARFSGTNGMLLKDGNAATIDDSANMVLTGYANCASARIGVDASNNVSIATDGHLTLHGTALAWDDLQVPSLSVGTGASAPDYISFSTSGNLVVYGFDGNTTMEQVYFTVQMPHAWKAGSEVSPHVHWAATTADAGTVNWSLEYAWANIGRVNDTPTGQASNVYSTPTTIAVTSNASGVAWEHQISELPKITTNAANKTFSSILVCRLFRTPTADTYAHDAAFLAFDIHYQKESFGSNNEYS